MKLPGWKKLNTAVYEHKCGVRAHAGGLVLFPNGLAVHGRRWPHSQELEHWRRVAGSNRRGVMAWAIHLMETTDTEGDDAKEEIGQ